MGKVVNDSYDAVTGICTTIQDLLALFDKMAQNQDKKMLKELIKDMKNEEHGYLTGMDDAIYGRVAQLLDERKVPYFSYDVLGSTKKYIFVAGKREDELKDIMNKAKILYGMEIDSKQELDDALSRTELSPKEKEYTNLTPEMAERVLEMARKHHVTVVSQKEENGTASLYCAEKDKEKVNRFVFSSAWDLTGKSGEIEGRRLHYMVNEKNEIENALKRVEEKMTDAYIFSASMPDCYIHIMSTGYEYVKHGIVSAKMRMEQDPVNYGEELKSQINKFPNAVYMPTEEVQSKGGPDSQTIQDEVKATLFEKHLTKEDGYTIQAEKELRNWLENKYQVGTDEKFESAKKQIVNTNLSEFQIEFAIKCKRDTPERETYYQRIISHSDSFQSHIEQASKLLETVQSETITLQRSLITTIEVAENEIQKETQKTLENQKTMAVKEK